MMILIVDGVVMDIIEMMVDKQAEIKSGTSCAIADYQ